ncbi:HU family DNA-binding protein [Bacteroides sp. 519]|uniref:HU family DNA-binding protein n=1 Tax=Bacteroides sp. 519 TaxID=2302937 RepID=UPI0013D56B09|nr:HU family DNA-binding protein [Bacteroides sp. 519]NDV56629.1 hypothetical protein [Bacteroides sp. 519]
MSIFTKKQEFTLHFDENKPTMYRMSTTQQQEVTFDELIGDVSNACGVSRAQTKASIEGLLDRMTFLMNYGMIIRLGDFGSFRPTINVKAQKTVTDVGVDNIVRKKIQFTPGKRFKNMLSALSFKSIHGNTSEGSGNNDNGGNDGDDGGWIDPTA